MASVFDFIEGRDDEVMLIKGLDPNLNFEELRNYYENCTKLSKLKLLSTNDQELIAAFQFDSIEAQYRGLARAISDGFLISKEAFVVAGRNPLMQKIINTQTRLRMRYPLQKANEPQEFKESLLQLLSKVGGYYKIKKDHVLADKQELIVLVDPNFTLGKLTTTRSFEHRGVEVSLEYLIDRISHEKLKQLVNPEHLTFDPNDLHRSKTFHLLLSIMSPSWNSDAQQSVTVRTEVEISHSTTAEKQTTIFTGCAEADDDKLEDLFDDAEEDSPEYSRLYTSSSKKDRAAQTDRYFSPENTGGFLQQFESLLRFPQQGQARSGTDLVTAPVFKAAILLRKMQFLRGCEFDPTMQEIHARLGANPSRSVLLAEVLSTLRKKYRKIRRKGSRLHDLQGDSDWGEQFENCSSYHETSDTFGSEELWKVLQSCDPEWRDFIWKYRTVDLPREFDLQHYQIPVTTAKKPFSTVAMQSNPGTVTTPGRSVAADASKAAARALQVEDSLQTARTVQPPRLLTPKPAGSPTPLISQDAPNSRNTGDDRWIAQHLESNLRFNRMVSPILWR